MQPWQLTITVVVRSVNDSLSAERVMALLSVFFAACALLVTAIGLYGTLAYATARRTSEIGIRMALGARRAQVVRLVCGQNALVAVIGTATGLTLANSGQRATLTIIAIPGGQNVTASGLLVNPGGVVDNVN